MRPQRFTTLAAHGLAVLCLGLAGTCAAHYGGAFKAPAAVGAKQAQASAATNGPPAREAVPRVRLANSGGSWPFSFLEGLFGVGPQSTPRRSRQREYRLPQSSRRAPSPSDRPPSVPRETAGGTYRTMCVRLCDGYYWPVSFATLRSNFTRDAQTCAKSCGASAALYYYPNPGGEAEDMVSLEGRPYKGLGTAFLYRATYDSSCKCRAHPWEEAAIERHKGYAKPGAVREAARGGRRSR